MTYVDGFVVPVPAKKVKQYQKMAAKAAKIWIEHGALSYKECVLEDKKSHPYCATFPEAFKLKKGEVPVFAYVEYKSRKHRDAVNKKVMKDARLHALCDPTDMPFDCKRMAYGGFKALVAY